MEIEAVTFDYWNTLVTDTGGLHKHRLDECHRVLTTAGTDLDRAALEAAFEVAWDRYAGAWKANTIFTATNGVDKILAELGLAAPQAVRDDMVTAFRDPPEGFRPPLTANVADCLAALDDAGVRIGIICDVGMTPSPTLRRYLDEHGVLGRFGHWSFSDEVGVYKPDPAIFTHALDGLSEAAGHRIDPVLAVHVGDLRRTDIAGAREVGMTAVRYSGANDDPGEVNDGTQAVEGDLVVDDHAALPAALGVTAPRPVPD